MYRSVVVKKELSRKVKLLIYQSIYVPTLTYGHELWVMTKRIRSQTQAAEMSFLRRVLGRSLRDREGNVNRAGGEAWSKLAEHGGGGERGDERGLAAEHGRGVNGRTGRYPWLGLELREDRKAEISGNIQS
ncbi:hypothetical protein QTP70_020251 [Hemibagrus guttatus]|uniref:Uncharacterized protein n=1 Tax=Hemibagrus guttatus TaxID=175788 RepID=A0AAE0PWQ9_9TELE|nr:hypothetical protein QTP70_020251 [Hemibagrus guttatus]